MYDMTYALPLAPALAPLRESIDHPEVALGQLLSRHQVSAFIKAFEASYGVTLSFEPEALSALSALADESGGTMSGVCDERFGDYGHGLKRRFLAGAPQTRWERRANRDACGVGQGCQPPGENC